jgi:CAAX protease family protein
VNTGAAQLVHACWNGEDDKDTMSSSTVTPSANAAREPVAPWWHTVLVLVPIAVGSIASWYQHGLPNASVPGLSSRLSGYFTVLVGEWFVVFLIWLALRRRGLSISSLVSGRWQTLGTFFRDLGLAVGFLVVAIPLVGGLAYLLEGEANSSVANITPKTAFELVVWLGLSATGGFCEELTFRGYLTRQFSAWTGSRAFAIVLQGVVFGLAHGYSRKSWLSSWCRDGLWDCLPTGARACAPECWPTDCKIPSAA